MSYFKPHVKSLCKKNKSWKSKSPKFVGEEKGAGMVREGINKVL
jgi:hypothetical protein